MKQRVFPIVTAALAIFFLNGCQRQLNLPDEEEQQPEPGLNQLPLRVVFEVPTDPYAEVWSIQYDTTNRQISVYYDDTTNATPFDQLKIRYEYNAGGYLSKVTRHTAAGESRISTIVRHADNRIRYIVNPVGRPLEGDTSFFSYQQTGDQTNIQVIGSTDLTYTYNSSHLLQSIRSNASNTQFSFTYVGSKPERMISSSGSSGMEYAWDYGAGLPDQDKDILLQLVMGKDYYVQQIKDFYFFFLFRDSDYVLVSATDPFHPTSLQTAIIDPGGSFTETRLFAYLVDEHNRVNQINAAYQMEIVRYTIRY